MKITLFHLITDDDDGMQCKLFTDEAKRDNAAWKWLVKNRHGSSVSRLKQKYGEDLGAAYEEFGGAGNVNYMNWNDSEIEVDTPKSIAVEAPDKALLAVAEAFRDEFGDVLSIEDEPLDGADAVDSVCRIWPLVCAALGITVRGGPLEVDGKREINTKPIETKLDFDGMLEVDIRQVDAETEYTVDVRSGNDVFFWYKLRPEMNPENGSAIFRLAGVDRAPLATASTGGGVRSDPAIEPDQKIRITPQSPYRHRNKPRK